MKKVYVSNVPSLLAEWDWNKNKGLSPDKVTIGSGLLIHWICPTCKGSYSSYPYNRSSGKGCPYCSGRKVLKGYNDLKSQCPELASEWDYNENDGLTPETISAGSNKVVGWVCNKGHKYNARPIDRRRGDGCPFCSGRKILVGFNDLETTNPTIAAEWHPSKNGNMKPKDVSRGMTKKVWWKCKKCGNEWISSPNSRTRSKGTGCPRCSNETRKKSRIQTLLKDGDNSLLTTNTFLASEWHPLKNGDNLPSQFTRSSGKTVWWVCSRCGYEWKDTINHRSNGRGCPNCSERTTSFSEQAVFYYVKNYFEDAISRDQSNGFELDIYIPSIHVGIEYDGAFFHGKNKHGMSDSKKDKECLKKGIKLFRIREKGLEFTKGAVNIQRATESNSSLENCIEVLLTHLGVSITQKPSIRMDMANINSLYTESFKKNSLAVLRPDIAAEWHPSLNGKLTPYQVSVRSGRECYWVCRECGSTYLAIIASRTAGHGCKICAHKSVGRINQKKNMIEGENDFATLYPEIAKEWDYVKNEYAPSEYLPGSNKKVFWICSKCGNDYSATIANRVLGRGCRQCSIVVSAKKRSKPVKCLETGRLFESLEDAAKWAGCSKSLISYAARKKIKKAKGFTWEYVIKNTI